MQNEKIYDFIVIGGGVVGAAVLDKLAGYKLDILLLEKEDDVAAFASRANSGIVHAGYDCEPNTLKARFNVRGNRMMWDLAEELDVPHLKCGSLVVARENQLDKLNALKEKGDANVVETKILNRAQTLEIEPHTADETEYSLYAPEAGIISPFRLTIALADRAVLNGARIVTEAPVTAIDRIDADRLEDSVLRKSDDGGKEVKANKLFVLSTPKGIFYTRAVINCAGPSAAKINDMAGAEHFETEYRRGDYFVLDSTERKNINTVIFPLPTAAGKGILVAPTADGNIIYGPTSIETFDGDTAAGSAGLDEIKKNVPLSYKGAAFNKCIRIYSGLRSIIGHDFIIKKSDLVENFIITAGICSPGLTSAPAIAEYIADALIAPSMKLIKKQNIIKNLPKTKALLNLSETELNDLIKRDARWGKIVCRCEKVTEAEIVNAIHSPLPAVTLDAVKRRTRAGMGRCQGGFCGPRVMEIISRELNIPLNEVRKGGAGSEIARFPIKEVE